MKSNRFFLLSILVFGSFIFLLPNFVEAECEIHPFYKSSISDCRWGYEGEIGVEKLGIIGTIEKVPAWNGYVPYGHPSCEDGSGKCKCSEFLSGTNGESCTAKDACWSVTCSECNKTGFWDASQTQCVSCSGGVTEVWIRGNTSDIYAGCAGFPSSCSDEGNAGNTLCESACGADEACDEKEVDQECGTGKKCDSNCQCVTFEPEKPNCLTACTVNAGYEYGLCMTSCSPFEATGGACYYGCHEYTGEVDCDYTCYCFNIATDKPSCDKQLIGTTCKYDGSTTCTNSGWSTCAYSQCDICDSCSAYKTADCTADSGCTNCHCKKDYCGADCDPNNLCPAGSTCQSDCACSGVCSGQIDAYPETDTAPCDFTIDIYNVDNCDGKTWEVRRNDSYFDSGVVTGDTDWSETLYDDGLGANSYAYNLYIEDDWKHYDSVACEEETPDCNCSWTTYGCDYSTCLWYQRGKVYNCTPSGCDPNDGNLECFCSENCCSGWENGDCGPAGGCATTDRHQTRDCGTCTYSESQCVSDPSCGGPEISINPPEIFTMAITESNISEDPNHPGKYRAILDGLLNNLGYDSTECPNCKCIVWFEWGTSGTPGDSGSYGNSNTPIEVDSTGHFYFTADNLDPGTAFKFEAFAKNGGSW